jgi:hypothetical protein
MELILKKQSDCGHMVIEIGIMPDLMYLLINVNHKNNVCYVVNRISGYYSQVLMEKFPELKRKLPTL